MSSTRRPVTLDIDHNGFDQVSSTTAREEDRDRRITTYTYWLDGLVKTRADDREENASGGLVRAAREHQFTYDSDGLLETHLDLGRSAGDGDDKRITTTYWPTDREYERLIEHRIGGTFQARQTTRRDYFANGLLQRLRNYGGAGEELRLRESHTLGYRDEPGGVYVNGNRTTDDFWRKSPRASSKCQNDGDDCIQKFVYDGADRLILENDGHGNRTRYELEPAGGVRVKSDADTGTEKTRSTFDGTRIDTFRKGDDAWKLHYDGEGNVDCITDLDGERAIDCNRTENHSPKLVEDFTYDYRNRLKGWLSPEGNRSTSYEHDALDRRVTEVERSGSSTTNHELSYVGATSAVAEERETGAHDRTRSYSLDAYGQRIGVTYQAGGGSPRELTYAEDPHGNISMLINEAGDTKASYGYTGYGEADPDLTAERLPDTDLEPGAGDRVNRFRYSGKRGDGSEIVDMGARQFSPSLGQFLQEDRYDSALGDLDLATDPLTSNRYALAAGNPVSFVESDGHAPLIDGGGKSRARRRVMRAFGQAQNMQAGVRQETIDNSGPPSTGPLGKTKDPDGGATSEASGGEGYRGHRRGPLGPTKSCQPNHVLGSEALGCSGELVRSGRKSTGNAGDMASCFVEEVSFGFIDFGGDKSSDRCMAGRIASYASIAKAGYAGLRWVGGKVIKRLRRTPQVTRNRKIGLDAEQRILKQYPGARPQQYRRTPLGGRYIDVLTPGGRAIESKAGRVGLDSKIEEQIRKDVALRSDPATDVHALEWRFSTNPDTGLIGPTAPLARRLRAEGIDITYDP